MDANASASTGTSNVPTSITGRSTVLKSNNGRILINSHLQVMCHGSTGEMEETDSPKSPVLTDPQNRSIVFGLGDCAADAVKPLPPLAQVAQQQGEWCAVLCMCCETYVCEMDKL
mgnify:CR=1 FL=1